MLNIKAAFMLVSAATEVLDTVTSHKKLPNGLSLGGNATLLLPLMLGPILSCRSGLTAQRLYDNNIDQTAMPIRFQNLNVLIYWVTCMFNAVYVSKSLHYIKNVCVRKQNPTADAFLILNEKLDDFIKRVKVMDVNTLPEFLEGVGPTAHKLIEGNLFPGVVSEKEGERRFLLNSAI